MIEVNAVWEFFYVYHFSWVERIKLVLMIDNLIEFDEIKRLKKYLNICQFLYRAMVETVFTYFMVLDGNLCWWYSLRLLEVGLSSGLIRFKPQNSSKSCRTQRAINRRAFVWFSPMRLHVIAIIGRDTFAHVSVCLMYGIDENLPVSLSPSFPLSYYIDFTHPPRDDSVWIENLGKNGHSNNRHSGMLYK